MPHSKAGRKRPRRPSSTMSAAGKARMEGKQVQRGKEGKGSMRKLTYTQSWKGMKTQWTKFAKHMGKNVGKHEHMSNNGRGRKTH